MMNWKQARGGRKTGPDIGGEEAESEIVIIQQDLRV